MARKTAALAPVVHRVHKEIAQTVLDQPALTDPAGTGCIAI